MVPVLLLCGHGSPGVRSCASGSHEASAARDPKGRRRLRPRAGAGGPIPRRQGLRAALRLQLPGTAGCLVRQVAGVQPRRHDALPCPPAPRGRDDQVQSAEDHRPGHRLALSQRAEEGAEGLAPRGTEATMKTRREFLNELTLAGTAGLLGLQPHAVRAEPPPEATRLRIKKDAVLCEAPAQVAEELLRAEGFSEVQYVWTFGAAAILEKVVAGEIDLALITALPAVRWIEAGEPLVILAGIHGGCFELIARERVRTIRDLKGKVIAVSYLGGSAHLLTAIMAASVGLDPQQDITWAVQGGNRGAMQYLIDGRADAFMGFPPEPQELRARKDRAGGREHDDGSALVPVLLLPTHGQLRIRTQASRCHQARAPSPPEGQRRVCARAGNDRPAHGGPRLHGPLRPGTQGGQRDPIRPVAPV